MAKSTQTIFECYVDTTSDEGEAAFRATIDRDGVEVEVPCEHHPEGKVSVELDTEQAVDLARAILAMLGEPE